MVNKKNIFIGAGDSYKLSRFAPSLTGGLHLGNLASLVYINKFCESYIWRIDGSITDPRSLSILRKQISSVGSVGLLRKLKGFSILGQKDTFLRGSINRLKRMGLLYLSEGCFKLKLGEGNIDWEEGNGKKFSISLKGWKDPILITPDGRILYPLASAIWDYNKNISLILRGRDLISSSVIQIIIRRALGNESIQLHHGLINLHGEKISKKKEGFWSLENIIKLYPGISIVKWIEEHSKRDHSASLSISNLATGDKILKEEDFKKWLSKDFRKLSWEKVKDLISFNCDEDIWESLKVNSSSLLDFKEKLRAAFTVKPLLDMRNIPLSQIKESLSLLRRLFWNASNSPSLKEALLLLPPKLIVDKLSFLIELWGRK